jgi:cytoskeletal protein CcmA (bactofilin family)
MEPTLLFSRRPRTRPAPVKYIPDAKDAPHRMSTEVVEVPAIAAAPTRSVIEAGLSISGDLEGEGDVLVNGHIRGNITCKTVTVGPDAAVDGGIVADEAIVHGRVTGIIRAGEVRLEETGRIEGDVYHSRLAIEAGAVFDGTSYNRKEPKRIETGKKHVATSGKPYVAELQAKAAQMLEELRAKPGAESNPAPAPRPPLAARRRVNGRKAMTTPPPAVAPAIDTPEAMPEVPEPPRHAADILAG